MIGGKLKILIMFRLVFGETDCAETRDGQFSKSRVETSAPLPKGACRTPSSQSLSGATFVAMMQSTDLGDLHNIACTRRLDRSFVGRILPKTQVRAAPMIILGERE